MSKKVKVVLSGSGTRYPCFVGALRRLGEEDYIFEAIGGTSGGALIASWVASHYDPSDGEFFMRLAKMAIDTRPGPLMDTNLLPFGRKGIYAGNRILEKLREELPRSFSETNIPCKVVTFNNNLARHRVWDSEDDVELPLTVRASMSLPGIFDLVDINGDWHSDGGIVGNFKLDMFGKDANVIGITFSGIENSIRRKIRWKSDLIKSHMDGAIEEAMLEDIEDVAGTPICYIRTKHGGRNFHMTTEDIMEQIREGYDSMDRFLKNRI